MMELTPSLRAFGAHCHYQTVYELDDCDMRDEVLVNDVSDEQTKLLLHDWYHAKSEYLLPMFDNQLSLSKHISIEASMTVLEEEMRRMCERESFFLDRFCTKLREALGLDNYYGWRREEYSQAMIDTNEAMLKLTEHLNRDDYLVGNRITDDFSFTLYDKVYKFTKGQKIMRAIGPIAKALGLEGSYENFREAHSQVLNTRTITGDLVLSLEPLDYATASDNTNGWSSCMSWYETGCYRAGTIEMMNSPCVICAYLKSDKNVLKLHDGTEWPSKKWRAWILCDKNFILCNRNYPYDNEALARIAMDWVATLAKDHFGWDYEPAVEYGDDKRYYFGTNLMYNDIDGNTTMVRWGSETQRKQPKPYYNYSGHSMCINCGEELSDSEASTLLCSDCRGNLKCHHCGDYIDRDDCAVGLDGEYLCWDCYYDLYAQCDCCSEVYPCEQVHTIAFPVTAEALTAMENLPKNHPAKKACKSSWLWGAEYHYPSTETRNFCQECLEANDLSEEDLTTYRYDKVFKPYVPYKKINNLFGFSNNISRMAELFEMAWDIYTQNLNEESDT